ncbi:WYL domain-containing protein [Pseudoflavonifractor phocaeensis]|uniref:WYL domain-containing protein n=1 Tax=Pseudoflavonifractor phocaeensis TaxID=1870988 RepID=UPI001FAF8879|nr:WYL domain-containing protein [Pseudoflavonifractor phocaeensis]
MEVNPMLFSEIYGSYFRVVAAVLTEACGASLSPGRLTAIVQEKAFAESALSIPGALRSGTWPLLDDQLRSVLKHRPTMPLTLLQKRWMKALLSDPRMALFEPDATGLETVEPLYPPDTFRFFDQYADGDPYTDPDYIACFRTVRKAMEEKRKLRIRFQGKTGVRHSAAYIPYRLEYSPKDDKFRLLVWQKGRLYTINMARMRSCELLEQYDPDTVPSFRPHTAELTLLLHDERNGLERVLLHFSHFEKETRKLDERLYQIKLRYDQNDETELLIRVLSFGPVLEVQSPAEFVRLVKDRVHKQLGYPQHTVPVLPKTAGCPHSDGSHRC